MSTKSKNNFYITTSIAYANANPHVGYALELLQADVYARYNRLLGKGVFYLTGTDEHGAKIARAAEFAGKAPKEFTDEASKRFKNLTKALNISNDSFIRTSDQKRHWPGVIKIWNAIKEKGDLYKDTYEGLYCVGHEAFVKKSDLKDGICPDHQSKPEVIKEENYFFALTSYKKEIEKLYQRQTIKILPRHRVNEVLNMLEKLEDISFSRPRKDISWGIPVPGDDKHTMYVWPDALTNYLSGIGYGSNNEWKKWWPADVHVIGKDILKFHAIIWPAMLLSAGLELPRNIYVHGFINVEGEKMSKSLGNIIDPFELIKKYGVDAVRYFLLREIPSHEDGDFSYKKLEGRYNADLANGLGNLIQRVAVLIEGSFAKGLVFHREIFENALQNNEELKNIFIGKQAEFASAVNQFKVHEALARLWEEIAFANRYINETKPWTLKNDKEAFTRIAIVSVALIHHIAYQLQPFLPETSKKIFAIFGDSGEKEIKNGHLFNVKKSKALFPKL